MKLIEKLVAVTRAYRSNDASSFDVAMAANAALDSLAHLSAAPEGDSSVWHSYRAVNNTTPEGSKLLAREPTKEMTLAGLHVRFRCKPDTPLSAFAVTECLELKSIFRAMHDHAPALRASMPEDVAKLVSEIEALHEKATPGPWKDWCAHWNLSTITHPLPSWADYSAHGNLGINGEPHKYVVHGDGIDPDDAALIAALRNAVPQILAALRAKRRR